MRKCVFIHPSTVVAQGKHNIFTRDEIQMIVTIGIVKAHVLRLNGDFADSVNRISCVYTEIGKALIKLRRINFDWPKVCVRRPY